MFVTKLYLVSGTKIYPPYQGDPMVERVKLLVPATSADAARKAVEDKKTLIDKITGVTFLYEVMEGCGSDENGTWNVINGLDSDTIYSI